MAEEKNIKGKINSLSTYYTDAYAIAVANGFKGTVAEWLDSLVGKSAYDIAVKLGFKGTEAEWLKSLKAGAVEVLWELVRTPELYGAVGDGVADDTAAIQAAVDGGYNLYCTGTYLVKDIVMSKPIELTGGTFIDGGSKNYIIEIKSDNVRIKNIMVDCKNQANGLHTYYVDNIVIRDSEIKNVKHTGETYGLRIDRSNNVLIDNCHIHHCTNDNSLPTRGISCNRSDHAKINNCMVHDIDSGDDADGIHVVYDRGTEGAADIGENDEFVIISFCELWNCRKRCIKLQRRNVLVENCTFLREKNGFACTVATISVYDSNITVRDNFINGYAPTQITLCGDSADTDTLENVQIFGNTLKNTDTSIGQSQGLIHTATSSKRKIHMLIIDGNTFIGNIDSTIGIVLDNDANKQFVKIVNNSFRNVYYGISLDYTTDFNQDFQGVIIKHNSFYVKYYALWTRGVRIYSLIATQNQFYCTTTFNNYRRFYYNTSARFYIPSMVRVEDNFDVTTQQNNPDNTGYYGKFINWIRNNGTTEQMPVYDQYYPIRNGYKYFNTDIHVELTWWGGVNGKWYYPDGTPFETTTTTEET